VRVVVKHPLLADASVPLGLIRRNTRLRVRIPLRDPTLGALRIDAAVSQGQQLFNDPQLSAEANGSFLIGSYTGEPGPFRISVPLIIAGQAVPLVLFGLAE